MKLYFDLIIKGIAVQVATNMPNAIADVPEKFDAKFVTPNQHVYTGEYHLVMPELGVPGGPLAPPIFDRSVNPIHAGGAGHPHLLLLPPRPVFFTFHTTIWKSDE